MEQIIKATVLWEPKPHSFKCDVCGKQVNAERTDFLEFGGNYRNVHGSLSAGLFIDIDDGMTIAEKQYDKICRECGTKIYEFLEGLK